MRHENRISAYYLMLRLVAVSHWKQVWAFLRILYRNRKPCFPAPEPDIYPDLLSCHFVETTV